MPEKPEPPANDPRRAIPSVESLLSSPDAAPLVERYGREACRRAIRETLEATRREEAAEIPGPAGILERVAGRLGDEHAPSLRRVLNGTGVLLHTNLGRAPLDPRAVAAALPSLVGYTDLEWDRETGRRAGRGVDCRKRLAKLFGAEAALVVGNNAAGVLLALRALAGARGEVLVSRGELVAIGGGFRIPEILRIAGCRIVEVGTTNRTSAADFRAAVGPKTRLLLRASSSNFSQQGFVASPSTAELAEVAREAGARLVVDQGSGAPRPLDGTGLAAVETVPEALEAGADVVASSGDKLLGGPQAGILAGRAEAIRLLEADPLYRAVRPGRFTYALLGEVAAAHLAGRASTDVPLYRMLAQTVEELDRRADGILRAVGPTRHRLMREPSKAVVGGGTTPGREVPSRALVISPRGESPSAIAARLRAGEPPVAATIESGRVRIDLRSILPEEDGLLAAALAAALGYSIP